jgi:Glycosyl transferase family 2
MRFLAVLTVRNEAAFLLEWLAHHKAVGFTDFLVFSNDCQDGTDHMLDRLAEMGHLAHVRNDGKDKFSLQIRAMKLAEKHPKVQQADWILPLDVDEFVNIHSGNHRLSDLLSTVPEATAITLTWRLFGNSGVVTFDDQPVRHQFTRCAPNPTYWPWQSAMFKTLYRNDGTYTKLGIHRPRRPDTAKLESARWYDCSGRKLGQEFLTRQIFSNFWQDNHRFAQLNHYALGAMQSFVLKRDRGRAVHQEDVLGLSYWALRNFNQVEDRSILRLDPEVEQNLADLKQDAKLAKLHAEGCRWRHRRFSQLMLREDMRTLYGQLQMTPPSRTLSKPRAEEMMQWARAGMALEKSR